MESASTECDNRFRPLSRELSGPWIQKPIPAAEDHSSLLTRKLSSRSVSYNSIESLGTSSVTLDRHLSLVDLVSVGIGGTIGSGMFVLCGLVAHEYAGPSAAMSWALSGAAACLSGCCYAELAARIPSSGSAYAYAYVSMGELPAILTAACLSLEYVAAAAGVARSWGDKVTHWLSEEMDEGHWVQVYLEPDLFNFNPLALLIAAASVALLANGVKESKAVTNFFTFIKVALVAFMVLAGFCLAKPSNWTPFIPSQFGMAGVVRGGTGTFFGYLGYDEVCCMAGEAQNPRRNLPLAILITLGAVTTLYIMASLSLTGMQTYTEISSVSGFPAAFRSNDAFFAAQLSALGEVITLPIVVLITIMAQPRLQFAMAKDGLLPPIFAELDEKGNMTKGTIISGALMVVVASFVPFEHLNDMISAAVLMALSMTDTSLLLLRHEAPDHKPKLAEKIMAVYHVAALLTSVVLSHFFKTEIGKGLAIMGAFTLMACVITLHRQCPQSSVFGGKRRHPKGGVASSDGYFRTPFLPFLPCLGIFVNWYLIAQLDITGILGILSLLCLATVFYFCYGVHHSVGNNGGWVEDDDDEACTDDNVVEGKDDAFTRSISLPAISTAIV